MKISFDYDETLSRTRYQRLARAFVDAGISVYIITSRCDVRHENGVRNNADLHAVADWIGIPEDNIHFTEGQYKATLIKMLGIDMHFDDMSDEIHTIRLLTKCKAVNIDL